MKITRCAVFTCHWPESWQPDSCGSSQGSLGMTAYGAKRKCWHGSLPAAIGGSAENICSPRVLLTVTRRRHAASGYSNVVGSRPAPHDSGDFRRQPGCPHRPVTARTASLIFARAKCPIISKSRCGRFGSSFETTTVSTIAGPSMAKASVSAAFNSGGFLAVNPRAPQARAKQFGT
jgi:hypothetical protein